MEEYPDEGVQGYAHGCFLFQPSLSFFYIDPMRNLLRYTSRQPCWQIVIGVNSFILGGSTRFLIEAIN